MNNRFAFEILAAAAMVLVLGFVAWGARAVAADGDAQPITSTFKVEGMTCGGCEAGVKLKVKKLDGVDKVEASYKEGRAVVTYDPEKVSPDLIIEAIEELGYTAELVAEGGPVEAG